MKLIHRSAYFLYSLVWRITRPITIGVRVLLIKDHSVVLVKHTYLPNWHLPGGGVDRGETLEQAARREALEEAGATLGKLTLIGVYSRFYGGKSDHVTVFACADFTLDGTSDYEIEECRCFDLDELPPDTSPGTRRRIHEFLHREAPDFGVW